MMNALGTSKIVEALYKEKVKYLNIAGECLNVCIPII
jgi:hypothetical protein